MTVESAVLAGRGEVRSWQKGFYKDPHQHPELSHQEHRTAGKVASRLGQAGYEVHRDLGGTGLVGVLRHGDGPAVLLRADMDALPVREATGLPYASTATAADGAGNQVPVAHACAHDMHVTCLLGAAQLLADGTGHWNGTVVALFQPAEETGDGARGMAGDHLAEVVRTPDVALARHILPAPAGQAGTHAGPVLPAADSMRVTVYGRGEHGSMPQATVDPVVLAAMIVVRLQTVAAREIPPAETAVLTVGSIQAGSESNVIPDSAVLQLNIRTYSERTRKTMLDAVRRIVTAECRASGCPKDPEFELFDRFPLTGNDEGATKMVAGAFAGFFGDRDRGPDQGRDRVQLAVQHRRDLPDQTSRRVPPPTPVTAPRTTACPAPSPKLSASPAPVTANKAQPGRIEHGDRDGQPVQPPAEGERGQPAARRDRQVAPVTERGGGESIRTSRMMPPSAVIIPSVTTPTMSGRAARRAVSAPLSANANVPVRSSASNSGGSPVMAKDMSDPAPPPLPGDGGRRHRPSQGPP